MVLFGVCSRAQVKLEGRANDAVDRRPLMPLTIHNLPNDVLELIWSHFMAHIQCAFGNRVSQRWRRLVKRGPMTMSGCMLTEDRFEPCSVNICGGARPPARFSTTRVQLLCLRGLSMDWTSTWPSLRHLELTGRCTQHLKDFANSDLRLRLDTMYLKWTEADALMLLTFLRWARVFALFLNSVNFFNDSGSCELPGECCPDLRVLQQLSIQGAAFLQANPQLYKLRSTADVSRFPSSFHALEHAEVSPLSLPAVTGHALRCLDLDCCTVSSRMAMRDVTDLLAATCPGLRVLRLRSNAACKSADLEPLAQLGGLERLELASTTQHDEPLMGLEALAGLTSLRITNGGVLRVGQLPRNLVTLHLKGCTSVAFQHSLPDSLRVFGGDMQALVLVGENFVQELFVPKYSQSLLSSFPHVKVVSFSSHLPIRTQETRAVRVEVRVDDTFPSLQAWFQSRRSAPQ